MKQQVTFFVILMIIGFMLAIQFQATKEPKQRDTRDVWQLRRDLQKEQKLQANLIEEMTKVEQTLKNYSSSSETSKFKELQLQKQQLMAQVGLLQVTGQGVILTVEPIVINGNGGLQTGEAPPAQLLSRLVNELNRFEATGIAINGERVISITPIRDVNQITFVNNVPLPPLPIEIKVLAQDAEKLNNRMTVSQVVDDFALENLQLTSKVVEKMSLPAYSEPLSAEFMAPVTKSEK